MNRKTPPGNATINVKETETDIGRPPAKIGNKPLGILRYQRCAEADFRSSLWPKARPRLSSNQAENALRVAERPLAGSQ